MPPHHRIVVAVMGSGTHEHDELAIPLGRLIAQRGYDLLTGAGGGAMQSVARAFVDSPPPRGVSIGIVPGDASNSEYRPRSGYPNPFVELAVFTHLPFSGSSGTDPASRNHLNVLTAHAIVFLPGGDGTLSEAILSSRYRRSAILYGEPASFARFPEAIERTASLQRVDEFLSTVLAAYKSLV
jgi:uncharacterized protein (TIGR00725 family)